MPTYEKYIHNLTYHEGNLASIDMEMDASFDMTGVSVVLEVRDVNKKLLFRKTSGTDFTINGQDFSIALLPADTLGRSGRHSYEIDFFNVQSQPFATIGGSFVINPEVNRATL